MSECVEMVKTVLNYGTPVMIKSILETWIIPRIKTAIEQAKKDDKIINFDYENAFEEYLKRSYDKLSSINTIVFQNQQKSIKDLYIPLTLQKVSNTKEKYKIEEYNNDFIPHYQRVLITDNAGMGKSTILKFLFLSCIEKIQGIPIYIELRKLSNEKTILKEISRELSSINEEIDINFVSEIINKGNFVFFLDGYDEIPLDEKTAVSLELEEFISKAYNNYFIIASRQEDTLASFGSFQKFNIIPLIREEAFKLIKKYSSNASISENLINEIKEMSNYQAIKEFLGNPMMVSLLYKGYEYKPIIPYKKHIFYRNVYDALFESHDFSKGSYYKREKNTGLDIEDFHQALRILGFITCRIGKIEYEKDELLCLIKDIKKYCPSIDFKESHLLADLIATVPLFQLEGIYYKWAHKSIQDYFAAQHICIDTKERQDELFRTIALKPEYYNIMELCWSMDNWAFLRTIVYDVAKKFISFCNTTFQNVDINISREDIRVRQAVMFERRALGHVNKVKNYLLPQSMAKIFDEIGDDDVEAKFLSSLGIEIYSEIMMKHDENLFEILAYESASSRMFVFLFGRHSRQLPIFRSTSFHDELSREIPLSCAIPIDDNPSSIINRKEYFNTVNNFLAERTNLLDYEKCLAFVEKIEYEQQNSVKESLYTL